MRTIKTSKRTLTAGATAAAVLGPIGYLLFFRHRCLTWGARDDEVAAKLPGDELLPDAGLVTTRAITVDAPPSAIWPWLAQMGSGRGGAYSYDWVENLLGLNVMRVEVLDPPRTLAIRIAGQNWVWIFALVPEGDFTRLISRNRILSSSLPPVSRIFYALLMEPGSLVMERKMLIGIKQRAERAAP